MNLPVIIAGIGCGMSFQFDGPTHHGMQDISVMRTLPEIKIYNPSDAITAYKIAKAPLSTPVYVRIDKGVLPSFYDLEDSGDWKEVVKGENICLVSTGYTTQIAVETAKQLKNNSVHCGVIDICRIKPIPLECIESLKTYKSIYVVEENSPIGGLGSALKDMGIFCRKLFSLEERQYLSYGTRDWFLKKANITIPYMKEYILNEK